MKYKRYETDNGGFMSMDRFVPPELTGHPISERMFPRTLERIIPPNYTLADTMYDRLVEQIAKFEKELDKDEEVGACLTHFGKDIVIAIENLGYHNPALVIFYGYTEKGDKVTLLQHMTQVNVLLCALKVKENRAPRRIGFAIKDNETECSETGNE
jgi:hypothetical protein